MLTCESKEEKKNYIISKHIMLLCGIYCIQSPLETSWYNHSFEHSENQFEGSLPLWNGRNEVACEVGTTGVEGEMSSPETGSESWQAGSLSVPPSLCQSAG